MVQLTQNKTRPHLHRPWEGGRPPSQARLPLFPHQVPITLSLNIIFARALAKLPATLQSERTPLYCVYYPKP